MSGNEKKTRHRSSSIGVNKTLLRKKWIDEQLESLEHEWTEKMGLTVFCGTWNVNGKKSEEDLTDWLRTKPVPDIYAIGFQEIVDLKLSTATSLVVDHQISKHWEAAIDKVFTEPYIKIASEHLVGILLCIYIRPTYLGKFNNVEKGIVPTGLMGVGGNKGGVAIRFRLFNSTLCFICSHLAAHQNAVQARNNDYHKICNNLRFSSISSSSANPDPTSKPMTMFDHNLLFWLGDLNYRLDVDNIDFLSRKIDKKDWSFLYSHDQLGREMDAKRAFSEFLEGHLNFAPTYKYIVGSDKYSLREDKKKRIPSWTDRILWKGDEIKQLRYERVELSSSDHKPVRSLFEVQINTIVEKKKKAATQKLIRQLDDWENEYLPKVKMSTLELNFSDVCFGKKRSNTAVIENVGLSSATFEFQAKMEGEPFCEPWLTITPEFGIIPPGQKTTITFTIEVDKTVAHKLNTGESKLQDVVIISLGDTAPSYFFSINGNYIKSCFGATIDWLIGVLGAVQTVDTPIKPDKVLRVPKELWRMVDYIFPKGLSYDNLFLRPGEPAEIEEIKECLDTNKPFRKDFSLDSMASSIILLFENLHKPVFPEALCKGYDGSRISLTVFCNEALAQLSTWEYNTFIYIYRFLREILKNKEKKIATLFVNQFAKCLMHASPSGPSSVYVQQPLIVGEDGLEMAFNDEDVPSGRGKSNQPQRNVRTRVSAALLILHHFLTHPDFA